MGWKPIFPEGITPAQRLDCLALHCDDTLRATGSLKEMTADWQFFTIGCIYSYGGLDYDIIAEYTQKHGDDCVVMRIDASYPIFTNMCPPGWRDPIRPPELQLLRLFERELCATPLEHWEGLRDWIAQVGLVDRRRGRYAQATMQDLEIVDHVAVDRLVTSPARPPTVTIAAFGIDGTHHHVGFVSRTSGPRDAAAVIKLPIREETRKVGQAILAGDYSHLIASLTPKPPGPPAGLADVTRKIQEAEERT